MVYSNGPSAKLIDQNSVPPCRISRVDTRNAAREPDTVGASALFNVTPIGRWTVHLNESFLDEEFVPPADIQLDLVIASVANY